MERTAHDLCTVCSRFAERLQLETADGGAIRPGTGMVFAPDLDRLRQRALNGCTVCQIVFQIILYNWDSADGSTFTSYLYGEPVELHIVELSDYLSEPEDEEDGLSPSRPRIPTRLCSPEPGPEPSYSDEGINAVAALVKGWLADCRKGHAQCDTAVSGQRSGHAGRSDAPTRLVDVGEEGDEMSLRILLNNEEDPVTEYITLSYAWGSRGSDIKLTASNIAQMTDVVDWARLPKTIQEAVIFTRKLGVRYIWVDALCIMQSAEPDDTSAHEDWHREAERFAVDAATENR
ncbi:hypothetical protein KHU50_003647 [Colletotrichum sp. SAR 10_65]|nr:hypothetical protein KHU50_003647 [Colletotrichum sp. SAR 10_65]